MKILLPGADGFSGRHIACHRHDHGQQVLTLILTHPALSEGR